MSTKIKDEKQAKFCVYCLYYLGTRSVPNCWKENVIYPGMANKCMYYRKRKEGEQLQVGSIR